MKDKVLIREYRSQDKGLILNLFRLNVPKYFSPDEEKDLINFLDREIEYYFVMEFENRIIGSGGFNFSGDEANGKISWDILDPDFQGRSLGSLLLKYRIEKLKGFKSLKIISVRTSQLVYPFYEKSGFKLVGQVKDYWAEGFDLYSMEYVFPGGQKNLNFEK